MKKKGEEGLTQLSTKASEQPTLNSLKYLWGASCMVTQGEKNPKPQTKPSYVCATVHVCSSLGTISLPMLNMDHLLPFADGGP